MVPSRVAAMLAGNSPGSSKVFVTCAKVSIARMFDAAVFATYRSFLKNMRPEGLDTPKKKGLMLPLGGFVTAPSSRKPGPDDENPTGSLSKTSLVFDFTWTGSFDGCSGAVELRYCG